MKLAKHIFITLTLALLNTTLVRAEEEANQDVPLQNAPEQSPVSYPALRNYTPNPNRVSALFFTNTNESDQKCYNYSPVPESNVKILNLFKAVDSANDVSMAKCNSSEVEYLDKDKRFSLPRCRLLYVCNEYKLSKLEEHNRNRADYLLNLHSARQFSKNYLRNKIDSMEKVEVLRKFAQEKFNSQVGKSCLSRFAAKESSACSSSTFVAGFKELQKNCNGAQIGCALRVENIDMPSYLNYDASYSNIEISSFQSYYDEKTTRRASKFLKDDTAYVKELSDLVTSFKFVNAKDEEKEEMFIIALKNGKDGYNDVVLSNDLNLNSKDFKTIKDSEHYKNLKNIFLKDKISVDEFNLKFSEFRKERVESQLGELCSDVPTAEKLCKTVTSMRKGSRSPVALDNQSLANIVNSNTFDKDSAEFEELKKLIGAGDSNFREADLELALDAKRCYAFGFSERIIPPPSQENLDGNKGSGKDGRGGRNRGGNNSDLAGDVDVGAMNRTMKDMGISGDKEKEVVNDDYVVSKDELAAIEETKNSIATPQYPSDDYANNYFNQSALSHFNDKDTKGAIDNKAADVVTRTEDVSSSSANDARISDLVKKLSATEERLEKLKASTEAAEEARVKEKKIAEENALIAELKGQINELKSKAQKPVITQAPIAQQEVIQNIPQQSNYSFGSSRSASESKNTSYSPDASESRSSKADSSSSSGSSGAGPQASRSIASASQLTLVNSESGNDQSGGLVLTRVDGMSSEKAAETISNKILELNGVPFLIEEDGITKKVIPLIRDGKIDLDENGMPKYVKIKVNRKECSKEDSDKGKCRAPAAVAAKTTGSVADEKREQEEKARKELERAQYIKLKALTNGALKKK